MAKHHAAFYFEDDTVLRGIYYGTTDYMTPGMCVSQACAWVCWRNDNGEARLEDCTHEGERCVASDDSRYWPGIACRECLAFKGPLEMFEHGYQKYKTLEKAWNMDIGISCFDEGFEWPEDDDE